MLRTEAGNVEKACLHCGCKPYNMLNTKIISCCKSIIQSCIAESNGFCGDEHVINLYFCYCHTNHYYYFREMRPLGAGSGCLQGRCHSWVGWKKIVGVFVRYMSTVSANATETGWQIANQTIFRMLGAESIQTGLHQLPPSRASWRSSCC